MAEPEMLTQETLEHSSENVEMMQAWKLGEFTNVLNRYYSETYNEEINVTSNTLNNYFRDLETKLIHYVNRLNGTKIYDKTDFNIAKTILEKRRKTTGFDQGWALEEIYKYISDEMECRPFPDKEADGKQSVTEEFAAVLNKFKKEMEIQFKSLEEQSQKSSQLLLEQSSKIQDTKIKKSQFELFMKQKEFRKEAANLWEQQPAAIRFEGLFFKREKIKERESFIEDYVEKKLMELLLSMDFNADKD